jgi:hypothetical protein
MGALQVNRYFDIHGTDDSSEHQDFDGIVTEIWVHLDFDISQNATRQ